MAGPRRGLSDARQGVSTRERIIRRLHMSRQTCCFRHAATGGHTLDSATCSTRRSPWGYQDDGPGRKGGFSALRGAKVRSPRAVLSGADRQVLIFTARGCHIRDARPSATTGKSLPLSSKFAVRSQTGPEDPQGDYKHDRRQGTSPRVEQDIDDISRINVEFHGA